jgi:SMC interacting uncharacterized protein involved in chromosome segregation
VTTFIKAEEQNYSLFTYVDQLNQEADKLDEQNQYLDSMIDSYKHMAKLNESQMHSTINTMKQDAELLRNKILQGNEECEQVQNEFENMQKTASGLVG